MSPSLPTAAPTFRLTGPLPTGHLSIEASAGTGKTYTLAALAVRLVAETGVEASQLLMVTFTRAATLELRSRVRERIAECARALSQPPAAEQESDPLIAHLATTDRAVRAARLARAVADFDAATITTIHGFAAQVLAATGARSATDRDATLLGSDADLLVQACADVLADASVDPAAPDGLPTLDTLRKAAQIAINLADVRVVPEAHETAAPDGARLLAHLVEQARRRVESESARMGVRGFSGILTDLLAALRGPAGPATVQALQQRFAVALIDEFQDTDPLQWEIFRRCFPADGPTRLVVVADPKQAIYSFRGANVHTYLGAVGTPGGAGMSRYALGTNWRSDGALLAALDVVFAGSWFGDPRIAFTSVVAAEHHAHRRALGADGAALSPLALRIALGPGLAAAGKEPKADVARSTVTNDLVRQVRDALDHTRIPHGDGTRAVRADDIAVLVNTRAECELVRRALVRHGIPAVLSRGGNVLDSPAADQWRALLAAVARPADPARARTFAVSWFSPHDADWLAAAGDAGLTTLQEQLHDWSRVLTAHGVSDFVRAVRATSDVAARVLGRPDGDRDLTDLDHIGQLLATSGAGERAGAAGLMTWLDTLESGDDSTEDGNDLTSRRLESEDLAVQIFTVWTSKGLEFPVVFVPFAWTKKDAVCVFQRDNERVFDVDNRSSWPTAKEAKERKEAAELEALGERLRLVYVALTRAKHRTVVWWSSVFPLNSRNALAHLLFARNGAALDPAAFEKAKIRVSPAADEVCAALAPLVEQAAGLIDLQVVGLTGPPSRASRPHAQPVGTGDLVLAVLPGLPDRSRARWSFTAIVDQAVQHAADPHDASLADAGAADEQAAVQAETDPDPGNEPGGFGSPGAFGPPAGAAGADTALDGPSETNALADLPAGAAFGTLVHRIMEIADTQASDLPAMLGVALDDAIGGRRFDLSPTRADGDPRSGRVRLIDGLAEVLQAPLGAGLAHRTLASIPRSDRLCEVGFELRLHPHRPATDGDIGNLLLQHLAPDDPYRAWAQGLAAGCFGVRLAGHLTGSIDAVLRVPHPQAGHHRYVVVDYKTNRLHPYATAARRFHYDQAALEAAMVSHDYPLQALLYAVALHRYLRGRLPGYDPALHLGGAAYLFVRGMQARPHGSGAAATPDASGAPGVCCWRIPPALVCQLSDLLAGASAPQGAR